VLDVAAGIGELDPHLSHAGLLRLADQPLDPASGKNLDVVVEEQQILPGGRPRTDVVGRGVVEPTARGNDPGMGSVASARQRAGSRRDRQLAYRPSRSRTCSASGSQARWACGHRVADSPPQAALERRGAVLARSSLR
jgi:hypothetical protein